MTSVDTKSAPPQRRSAWPVIWSVVIVALVAVIAHYARPGAVSPRIRNPHVVGEPRPVDFLFGFDHWITVWQIFTIFSVPALVVVCVLAWRRNPGSPIVLMAFITTAIVWQDPFMNWAPYAVYNPALWHWPEDWPWVSLSPTVEPFIVIGYVMFQFGPYFPAVWILRKLQARKSVDSFVWRHPLVTLGCFIFGIGFLFDMMLELTLVRTGLYIYSQVIPFGSIFTGTPFQFPLLWESTMVTFVMIPAGILVYRDDTGRTVAEKLSQRARIFAAHPTLGMFTVMFVIVNIAYICYGVGFTAIRVSGAATSVACPWPYPEAKVYDPQGYYEANGQQGPYSVGIMSTWMSGIPNGRPDVQLGARSDRCAPSGQHG
ncbi:MAG: spirocyclase AveC family protein [Mycobacterium sp.]|nr:spirocyclase AveC family protein [Mycobacterium sp.]